MIKLNMQMDKQQTWKGIDLSAASPELHLRSRAEAQDEVDPMLIPAAACFMFSA